MTRTREAMLSAGAVATAITLVFCGSSGGASSEDTNAAQPEPDTSTGLGPRPDGPALPEGSSDAPSDVLTEPDVDAGCGSYPFSAAALLAERVGFGAKTVGGSPSNVVHVTTLADTGPGSLRAALLSTASSWIVFDVNGTIKWATSVHAKSSKTVDGRGRSIVIEGELKLDAPTTQFILSDVALRNPNGTGDVIGVRGHGGASPASFDTHDLWFHHLELSKGGDGLLDLRGATGVTLSWNHLHTHSKALLHARNTDDGEAGGMRVTYHHNWFEKISRRGPQFAFGEADFFNNFQDQWYEFGAAGVAGARFLSEANIYAARPGTICFPVACPDPNSPTGDSDLEVSKAALVDEIDTTGKGNTKSVNDLLQNGAVVTQTNPGAVFSRATYYAATVEPATPALATKIKTLSGPRTTFCK